MRPRPSRRIPTPHDPLLVQDTPVTRGQTAFEPPKNVMERGVILNHDVRSGIYRVHLNSGRTMLMSRIRAHPGDMTVLPTNTYVVVTFALGLPYICGVLPPEAADPSPYELPDSITDTPGYGGEDPILSRNMGATARGEDEPRDVAPGDFVNTSPDGASVSALGGRVAQLRGSSLAKIQAFGDTDFVRIVAGVLETITWMGSSKIVNNNGKTSFIWRGGTDQLTQTGFDEERYTIHLDVGDSGNMVLFQLTNRDGQEVFRLHIDPQGKVDVYAAGGTNIQGGNSPAQRQDTRIDGAVTTQITGAEQRIVEGSVELRYGNNLQQTVSNNQTTFVGQDNVTRVSRDQRVNIGGDLVHSVTGKLTQLAGNDVTTEVSNGANHAVKTNGGTITQDSNGGAVNIRSQSGTITIDPGTGTLKLRGQADRIELGGNPQSHVTKWEELNTRLTDVESRLNQNFLQLATHTHPISGAVAAVEPSLSSLASPITFNIANAKSSTTKVE